MQSMTADFTVNFLLSKTTMALHNEAKSQGRDKSKPYIKAANRPEHSLWPISNGNDVGKP